MRPALWVLHLALPMLALWLLIARPSSDVHWEHHHAHFGLVLATAVVNVGLGLLIIRAASRRHDARLFLVALGFLVAAGFLGLHALATPGVFLEKNAGFQVATPVGLFLAAVLAAASSIEYGDKSAATLFRLRAPLLGLAGAVLLGWAVWSLGGFAPLDRPITPEESEGPLLITAYAGAALGLSLRPRRPALDAHAKHLGVTQPHRHPNQPKGSAAAGSQLRSSGDSRPTLCLEPRQLSVQRAILLFHDLRP